jgi:hypothetical protein
MVVDQQQVVADIRSFLHSSDQTVTDSLRQLAKAYNAACQDANQRLRRCADFLQQGLRTEAIHLAQAEPVLLDVVAALDFPELAQWEEICLAYGLPSPVKLQLEAAEALNEAYADVLPLEDLLRRHRLLALARAPLASRLKTMRRIHAIDAANPVWADDIRLFEKARFEEIQAEVKQAIARDDTSCLVAGWEEVEKTKWLEPLPAQLITYVETAARRSGRKRLREHLDGLQIKLNEAFAALDVAEAKRLRSHWDSALENADLPLEDPIRERALPALHWLAKEERREALERKYQAALSELSDGLLENSTREDLEARHAAAEAFGRPLPAELAQRYRSGIASLDRAARMRRIRIAAGTVAIVALIIGSAAFWIYHVHQTDKVARAVERIESMLNAGEITEAKAYVKKLQEEDPAIAKRQELDDVRKRLTEADAAERKRVQRFKDALRRAKAAPPGNGNAALAEARKLARLPEEIAQVAKLEQEGLEQADQSRRQHDEELRPGVNALNDKLNRLERLVQEGLEDNESQLLLTELEVKVPRLVADANQCTEAMQNIIRQMSARLDSVKAPIERGKQEVELKGQLTRALSATDAVEAYRAATARYVEGFPKSSRAENLKKAIDESELWAGIVAWHKLVEPSLKRSFVVEPAEARAQATKVQQFIDSRDKYVDTDAVLQYLDFLDALAQRQESTAGSAAEKLRKLFSNLFIRDLWYARLKNGKVFYLAKDLAPAYEEAKTQAGKKFVPVSFLVNFEGKQQSKQINVDDIDEIGRAPQSILADELQKIPDLGDINWEEFMITFAQRIRNNKEIDPILQLTLLKQVLENATRGSCSLRAALGTHRQKIDEGKVDLSAPWINPNSDSADAARPSAKDLLRRIPSLEPVPKVAAAHQQKFEQAVSRSCWAPIGWLTHDRTGYRCCCDVDLSGYDELCVLMPKDKSTPVWEPVARVINGKPGAIGTTDRNALLEGRWIFARNSAARLAAPANP